MDGWMDECSTRPFRGVTPVSTADRSCSEGGNAGHSLGASLEQTKSLGSAAVLMAFVAIPKHYSVLVPFGVFLC